MQVIHSVICDVGSCKYTLYITKQRIWKYLIRDLSQLNCH